MEFEKLKEIIAEVLNVDVNEITKDTTFVDDLGADSLDIVELIMALEEEFDLEIPDADAEKVVTVNDVVEYIKDNVQSINLRRKDNNLSFFISSISTNLLTMA